MDWPQLGAVIASVLGGMTLLSERRIRAARAAVLQAESDNSQADTTSKVSELVFAMLDRMQRELDIERNYRVLLWDYVKVLRRDIESAGIEATPIPDDLRKLG